MPIILKLCTLCKEKKPLTEFPKGCTYKKKAWCRACHKKAHAEWIKERMKNPAWRLWFSTSNRARNTGQTYTISVEYIESIMVPVCPYFGIVMDYKHNKGRKVPNNAATVDKIDPTIGYVPGNVRIICSKANRIKSNLSREELLNFARNIIFLHSSPSDFSPI